MAPSSLVSSYLAATTSTVGSALTSIINALPTALSPPDRKTLIQALLTDISTAGKSRVGTQDVAQALLALKTIGRTPTGSEGVVSPENLQILVSVISSSYPSAQAAEGLRCVANALLLHEAGRDRLLAAGGGELGLRILSSQDVTPEYTFLASRILFLMTLKQLPFVSKCVEEEDVVGVLSRRMDALLPAILANEFMAKEALTDLLKFEFNILLQYPRMVEAKEGAAKGKDILLGELWVERFEPLLPSLLRLFNTLPPTTPPLVAPLTHVIHALIGIPVNDHLAPIWFGTASPTSGSLPSGGAARSSSIPVPSSSKDKDKEQSALSKAFSKLSSSFSSGDRNGSPTSSRSISPHPPVSSSPPTRGSTSSRQSTSKSSSSPISSGPPVLPPIDVSTPPAGLADTVQHVYDLIASATLHYVPGDPDDPSVRALCTSEGNGGLDEILAPSVVLLTRLVAGDKAARARVKGWILPADLDRSSPLEERSDFLGRCLRLLGSVYFPRIKDAVGELLFAICDSDSLSLSAQIGYGNAAGFLFNKGILAPPPGAAGSSSTSDGATIEELPDDINPITGAKNKPRLEPEEEMTEEEKEREAEKLFVLFDRLEKKGIVQNPIRKAIQEGKLQF